MLIEERLGAAKRVALIDQLDRSFFMLPTAVKTELKAAMGRGDNDPFVNALFTSFRQVIEFSPDEMLLMLRDLFDGHGDLLPAVPRQ